jgi:DNA polymerase-3 subunit delta'
MTWDMLGHHWAAGLLKEHILQNSPRHAYLFTGPHSVGRRTLALRFAQALDCPQPKAPGEPCQVCRACQQIEAMQYPDLSVVQSEGLGGTLKVDQIRELGHTLSLSPYQANYRVALLLRFEEANLNAANALLKTLEEPAPQVILVLTAENEERLLPTIVSRCEILRLRPLPLQELERGLQDAWGVPPEQARLLAHLSGGRPGYAHKLYHQPESLDRRTEWLEDLRRLVAASRVDRFAYSETLSKDKDTLRSVMHVWLSYWRDVLLRAAGASNPLTNLDRSTEIEELAARLGVEPAQRAVAGIGRTFDLLDSNANTRLALDVLLLDFPSL